MTLTCPHVAARFEPRRASTSTLQSRSAALLRVVPPTSIEYGRLVGMRLSRQLDVLVSAAMILACGPETVTPHEDGSGGGTSSGETSTESAEASADATTTSTGADTSTGSEGECPDNVAVEPLCYRFHALDWSPEVGWGGPSNVLLGNFGADASRSLLLIDAPAGSPLARVAWVDDALELTSFGANPGVDGNAGWTSVRMIDGVQSDLAFQNDPGADVSAAGWNIRGPALAATLDLAPESSYFTAPNEIAVLDANGDGLEEVLVQIRPPLPDGGDRTLRLYGWDTDALVQRGDDISLESVCGALVSFAVGDYDGDGIEDVGLVGLCKNNSVPGSPGFVILWGTGDFSFERTKIETALDESLGWLGVGDFDGDGLDDAVVAVEATDLDGTGGRIDVHLALGDRSFAVPATVWSAGDPGTDRYAAAPLVLRTGDVDGDALDDVMLWEIAITSVAAEPNVVAAFVDPEIVPQHGFAMTGDVNGDGRMDFVAHSEARGNFALISSD